MSENSEYQRGVKWARQYYGNFRSFKKQGDGYYLGYKINGSTEVIPPFSHSRPSNSDHGFLRGAYDEGRRIINSKPTKERDKMPKINQQRVSFNPNDPLGMESQLKRLGF